MKKILLSIFSLLTTVVAVNAQKEVVINEIYPDPSVGNEEYIELYNTTASPVNLDCYTLVSYNNVGNGGAWVYQLPNITIPAFGHVVFANAVPISHQGGTYNGTNQYSWNSAGIATFSSLTEYSRSGNTLTATGNTTTNDFVPITGGNSTALALMLFNPNGTLTNAFFANNSSGIPAAITSLVDLSITLSSDVAGGCNGNNVSLQFDGIAAPEAEVFDINAAPGTDNGYRRTRDGFCGTWEKNEPANTYSPGQPNSNLPPINTSTSVVTSAVEQGCGNAPGDATKSLWNISVQITDAGLLPGTYRIYEDANYSGGLNPGDNLLLSGAIPTTTAISFPNTAVKRGSAVIIQVITASGCIQITRAILSNCIPLPVEFKSFTATRNRSTVALKWETASEQNNSGFTIERNVNGSWEQIGWVPTQAPNGNSDAVLTYFFNDLNNAKGISQYRIRQVDIDTKSKLSEIRSVRGDGQIGKTIVYPNPSNNGKVNILFEDASVTREVSVSDMSGRVVRQMKGITNNNITIENLNPGMYTVRIVAIETGEQAVEKIVVNKR